MDSSGPICGGAREAAWTQLGHREENFAMALPRGGARQGRAGRVAPADLANPSGMGGRAGRWGAISANEHKGKMLRRYWTATLRGSGRPGLAGGQWALASDPLGFWKCTIVSAPRWGWGAC